MFRNWTTSVDLHVYVFDSLERTDSSE